MDNINEQVKTIGETQLVKQVKDSNVDFWLLMLTLGSLMLTFGFLMLTFGSSIVSFSCFQLFQLFAHLF